MFLRIKSKPQTKDCKLPDWRADGLENLTEHVSLSHDRESLCNTMSREVGIVRRFTRLHRASRRVARRPRRDDVGGRDHSRGHDVRGLHGLRRDSCGQVRGRHVVDTASNVVDAPGMTSVPTCEHFFDDLPL